MASALLCLCPLLCGSVGFMLDSGGTCSMPAGNFGCLRGTLYPGCLLSNVRGLQVLGVPQGLLKTLRGAFTRPAAGQAWQLAVLSYQDLLDKSFYCRLIACRCMQLQHVSNP